MMSEGPIVPTLNAAPEKPAHYHYLKSFRVEPCALFKQHQCQQHRPYTCFYWHFGNQRRRQPLRRRDGTFNYSADIYCAKYDENTGQCGDGDECPLLHRVAGDVERKYHVRYYKTALCVHATDGRGQCAKNGAHCAFAHNDDDVRIAVFDIRELQHTEAHLDLKDRTSFVVEDPVWQEQCHVLSCYKTEPCRKPPRLCRQGYACPYYHNAKDRRRPPAVHSYRSTPCPASKTHDEWADPLTHCEALDTCIYCHTRTEQQFHPEIYKSTKCNDMLQHGYCPRGPFCAFAHNDDELHADRKSFVPPTPTIRQTADTPDGSQLSSSPGQRNMLPQVVDMPECPVPPSGSAVGQHIHRDRETGNVTCGSAPNNATTYSVSYRDSAVRGTTLQAVLKQQRGSLTGAPTSRGLPMLDDRAHNSPTFAWNPIDADRPSSRIRTSSLNVDQLSFGSGDIMGSPLTASGSRIRANSFGNNEQQTLPNLGHPTLNLFEETSSDEHLPPICENDEAPIPYTFADFDDAPTTRTMPIVMGAADPFFHMSGSYGSPNERDGETTAQLQRAREELQSHRAKVFAWEEGLKQARHACEAWRREAENNKQRVTQLDMERRRMKEERDVALGQVAQLRAQLMATQQQRGLPLLMPVNTQYGTSPSQLDAFINQLSLGRQMAAAPSAPMCGRCGHVAGTPGNGCGLCHSAGKTAFT